MPEVDIKTTQYDVLLNFLAEREAMVFGIGVVFHAHSQQYSPGCTKLPIYMLKDNAREVAAIS